MVNDFPIENQWFVIIFSNIIIFHEVNDLYYPELFVFFFNELFTHIMFNFIT